MLWAKHIQEYEDNPVARSVGEILNCPKYPIWERRDSEKDYRRGFLYGLGYAIDLIEQLKEKGFIRPQEIANIISKFHYEVILPWRYKAARDVLAGNFKALHEHPRIAQESWSEIRARIIYRDGGVCKGCGSDEELHVDHIQPVCQGGTPTDDNLQTLCKDCNLRKARS